MAFLIGGHQLGQVHIVEPRIRLTLTERRGRLIYWCPEGMSAITAEFLDLMKSRDVFSDIHIEPDAPIMLKTPRGWEPAGEEFMPWTMADVGSILDGFRPSWEADIKEGAIGHAADLAECRVRITAALAGGGRSISISARRQPLSPPKLDKLGLPYAVVKRALEESRGLIIVTGQTGAGKTTSLASMLDYINDSRPAHICTIEDPTEFVHIRNKSIFTQREVPTDVKTFAQGLREALRQKPDVLLVGEIRDKEVADVVMTAAESGVLVLVSMHSNSALGAINKLISFFPQEEGNLRAKMLADNLLMVVSQTLMPSKDKQSFVLAHEWISNFTEKTSEYLSEVSKLPKLQELFSARSEDAQSLNANLYRLVKESKVDQKDAIKVTNNRIELDKLLAKG